MAYSKDGTPLEPAPVRARRVAFWITGVTLWLLVLASLVSHSAGDWPGFDGARPAETANWIGPAGAWVSHHLLLVLGPGTWVLMGGLSAWMLLRAFQRPLKHLWARVIGLALVAVSVSAGIHTGWVHLLNHRNLGQPHLPGGLLGSFASGELVARFAPAGTLAIFGGTALLGWLLASEETLFWFGRMSGKAAKHGAIKAASAAKAQMAKAPAAPAAPAVDGAEASAAVVPAATAAPAAPAAPADEAPAAETKPRRSRKKEADPTDAEEVAPAKSAKESAKEAKEAAKAAAALEAKAEAKEPVAPSDEDIRKKMESLKINIAGPAATKKAPPPREQDLSGYKFPPMAILGDPDAAAGEGREEALREQAIALQHAMSQYDIEGEVVGISSGPVVTLYEVKLAPGTRVAQLERVDQDLARALRASNIRIVPTMSGRDTVGIEVPNAVRQKVVVKELMTAMPDAQKKMALPMYLGKDASGNPLVEDLAKAPHMLIAGTTGSGKSVCMNSILLSLLFTRKPDELKLILVDPKTVEMAMYKSVPHLMCPVITDMNKAVAILEWACGKMDDRFKMFEKAQVKNIAGYNELTEADLRERFEPASEEDFARIPKKMPYIVIVVDELADLMMTNPDVEGHIVRIAQKARACGMHLILATQRPSANVVTGLIKSNMPTRVCMKVNSALDSRIMLDKSGGEVLLGNGDMLFLSSRSPDLFRAQGCFIADKEVLETAKFLKEVAQQSFEQDLVQIKAPGDASGIEDRDELFEKAVDVLVRQQRGSTTLLQTTLGVGYSRATRIMEQIAAAGFLGEHKGSQARDVLVTPAQWEQMKAEMRGETAPAAGAETKAEATAAA